nr:G protein-coupled receptor [Proales similis]
MNNQSGHLQSNASVEDMSEYSAFDLFIINHLNVFENTMFALYAVIFVLGIIGNALVIFVLVFSLFIDQNERTYMRARGADSVGLRTANGHVVVGRTISSRTAKDFLEYSGSNMGRMARINSLLRALYRSKLAVTNFYLFNLAISDFVYLMLIPVLLFTMISTRWMFGALFCRIYLPTVYLCQCSSIFILIILTIDRYLSVKYPYSVGVFRTHRKARLAITISWLLSFVFVLPVVFFTRLSADSTCLIEWPEHWTSNATIRSSKFLNDYFPPLHAFTIYTFLLNYLIPLSIILIFYTQILRILNQRARVSNRPSSRRRLNRRIEKMVLVIVVCYVISWTPYWFCQLFNYFYQRILREGNPIVLTISSHFVQVIAYLSSMLNPFIYSYLTEGFRSEFKLVVEKFCCVSFKPDRSNSQDTAASDRETAADLNIINSRPAVNTRSQSQNSSESIQSNNKPDAKKVSCPKEACPLMASGHQDTAFAPINSANGKKHTYQTSTSNFKFEINFHGLRLARLFRK